MVVDTPHFAATDGKGPATLANLSAGKYVVHVWHSDKHAEPDTIAVTLGGSDRKELQFVIR